MKRYLLAIAVTAMASGTFCQAADSLKVNLMPTFHVTLKTRYENDIDTGEGRFQVRNARFCVMGDVTREIDYKIEVDFCDRGKIKVLDAFTGFKPIDSFKIQMGQIRIPFSIDASRPVYKYYFGDYSYIGRFVGGIRGCGLKLDYTLPGSSLNVQGSVYNTYQMTEQNVWQKQMSYALEGRYSFGMFTPVIGFESNVPDGVRINNVDAALVFDSGRWHAEAEYMMKHYTHRTYDTAHAYSVFGSYEMPVKAGVFNRLSFQARFDGMTDYSNGQHDGNRLLTTTETEAKRITVGSTLTYLKLPVTAFVRLNYYHVFRPDKDITPAGEGNKIMAEMVLRF